MDNRKLWYAGTAFAAAVGLQVATWFALYPLAGYNDVTMLAAQAAVLLLGAGLIVAFRIGWGRIGLGWRDFLLAVLGIAVSYGVLLASVLVMNALGSGQPLFRQSYRLYAFANNWILTGFGEELLFAGVIFNLVAATLGPHRRWIAVLLTAVMFGFWHLPGYLAVGLDMGTLGPRVVLDVLLNIVSWGFLGTFYLLSGNLWLTAFAHASTDYALLPAVVDSPALGLVFMVTTLFVAWGFRRLRGSTRVSQLAAPGSI